MNARMEWDETKVQASVSPEEWQTRVDLAACYRAVAMMGWDDLVFTHITAKIPGEGHNFLINPYGLMFEEITASSLVKIDLHGNKLDGNPHPINPAGFVIHSAVHAARENAQCVLHTHSLNGVAVSAVVAVRLFRGLRLNDELIEQPPRRHGGRHRRRHGAGMNGVGIQIELHAQEVIPVGLHGGEAKLKRVGAKGGVPKVFVDGVEHPDGAIPMVDDHVEHNVEIDYRVAASVQLSEVGV